MSQKAPAWVEPVMRFGYGARGLVYLIVGSLTFLAAWQGGRAEGTSGTLSGLASQPFGLLLLWVIAIGLAAYGLWRLINAAMDLEDHGTDAKGLVARLGLVTTGLIHFGLAISVGALAAGAGSGGGDGKVEDWTAQLMALPFGRWLVGIVGVITIGAALYYGWKGVSEKYKSHIRRTALTERLDPAVKAGLVMHGVVVALIGAFLIYAAATANPDQAGGLGQAFETVRSAAYGAYLLMVLALGLVGFAVYCWIEAAYRVIPARAGSDIRTLARKANPAS